MVLSEHTEKSDSYIPAGYVEKYTRRAPEECYSLVSSPWISLPYWKNGCPVRRIKTEDALLELSQDERMYLDWWLDRQIKAKARELAQMRAIASINSQILEHTD